MTVQKFISFCEMSRLHVLGPALGLGTPMNSIQAPRLPPNPEMPWSLGRVAERILSGRRQQRKCLIMFSLQNPDLREKKREPRKRGKVAPLSLISGPAPRDHRSLSAHRVCFRSVHQGPEAQGPIACITVGNRGSAQLSLLKATAACVGTGDQEKRTPGTFIHAVLAGEHHGRGWGGRGLHGEGGAATEEAGQSRRGRGSIVPARSCFWVTLLRRGQNPSFLAPVEFLVGAR